MKPSTTAFHERDLVALFLVRSVEEHDPSFFTPEVLSEAALAAVDAGSDAELLEKRTSYLFLRLPRGMRAWARIALFPENSLGVVVLATFLVGVLSNYLGPSGLVHVAYNPLAFLVLWNLGVYTVLVWRRMTRLQSIAPAASPKLEGSLSTAPTPHDPNSVEPELTQRSGGIVRFLIGDLWLAWNRRIASLRTVGSRIKNTGEIAVAFWDSYWDAARPLVIARITSLLHAGAIGLFIGAVVGTYARGFFFEYNAIWRSTFLTDPASVATFLNVLLGPACLVIDGRLLTPDAIQPLLLPHGTIAAAWLHRLVLMGTLTILLPRCALAAYEARHARRAADRIHVDISQGYYVEKVRAAREDHIHRIRDGIAVTIRVGIGKFAESVALFVRDQFFDKSVAPTLFSFRNKGGRISDLQTELSEHTATFEPQLLEHLRTGQIEFQQSVRIGVQSVVGKELTQPPNILGAVSPASIPMDQSVTGSVASNVGDAIGATVTAAVTAAVATISGGIGKTLGVAILSGLLGASGPVGLLIGGIAAAAAVGGAYWLGRDRVTAAVKRWRIPASIAAIALRDSKLERAREATYSQVKNEIQTRIEPLVEHATESILKQFSLAVDASRGEDRDRVE